MEPFGIGFSDQVYEGEFKIGDHTAMYSSGTSIAKFPKSDSNYLVFKELNDQGADFLSDILGNKKNSKTYNVPILGLAQFKQNSDQESKSGRIVVYGDSNCIDSNHMKMDCFWLLSAVIEFAAHNLVYSEFNEVSSENFNQDYVIPQRIENSSLLNYSKTESVLDCEEITFEKENWLKKIAIKDFPNKKYF